MIQIAKTVRRQGASFSGYHAADKETARRNRRIKAALTRRRNPLNQEEAAAQFGLSQPQISLIFRNENSDSVAA